MKKLSNKAKQLIAEFLSNIGVAWFAAGVIGVFLGGAKTFSQIIISVGWGLLLSLIFPGLTHPIVILSVSEGSLANARSQTSCEILRFATLRSE